MTAAPLNCRVILITGIAMFLSIPLIAQQETTSSLSDIFLLDLGIVIEPASGKEFYNRQIDAPSKEVDFRIKKITSGSVYMATSKELLEAINRINNRISNLETSFQNELMSLKVENAELRNLLARAAEKPPKPVRPNIALETTDQAPVVEEDFETKELPVIKVTELAPIPKEKLFDQQSYMAGVFAYQREDYYRALSYFADLQLDLTNTNTAENVLYWMADAFQQIHDYNRALNTLDVLLKYKDSDRIDDALIKKGLLYKKLGDTHLAMQSFKEVVNQYPESEYSRLAAMEIKRSEIVLQ